MKTVEQNLKADEHLGHFKMPIARVVLRDREAAEYIGVSRASVWGLLKAKAFPCVRIGGRTLFRRADLDAYIASCVQTG